jgi:Methionine synthase I (cobalamin-dependent), methyltransferase domain
MLQAFQNQRAVLADGAMGTRLLEHGLRLGDCTEAWNIDPKRSQIVRSIHRSYLEVGAQLILTNTLGANRFRLAQHGLTAQHDAINAAGVTLARTAAQGRYLVAGSIGPSGFQGDYHELQAGYTAQARALAAAGVDLLWIETMGDPNEARAALLGAKQAAEQLPVIVSFSFQDDGRTYSGASINEIAANLQGLGLAAIGANCGTGPASCERALVGLQQAFPELPLVAKSNLGLPQEEAGQLRYPVDHSAFQAHAERLFAINVAIIGACCGSTPSTIQALAEIVCKETES